MINPDDPGWTWQRSFSPESVEKQRLEDSTFVISESGFHFIDAHFGPRPGCLHSLMGSTGRGKSTLIQSLILEWGKKVPILLYLTEESLDRIEASIVHKELGASYLSTKLHMTHESEILKRTSPYDYLVLLRYLDQKLSSSNAKILIIDNMTTSQFYENKFESVNGILSGLRELGKKYQIPIFLICHTKKGVNETTKGLMLPDDVRGSSSLAMTSDYFYTFHRFRKTNEFGNSNEGVFVYVSKCRNHDNQDCVYRLEFNVNTKRYIKDIQVDFNAFKTAIKERDRV